MGKPVLKGTENKFTDPPPVTTATTPRKSKIEVAVSERKTASAMIAM